MLLDRRELDGIASGSVSLVFRWWLRPTVKAGGRLRTAIGELAIEAVDVVEPTDLDPQDAAGAGYPSADALAAAVAAWQARAAARGADADPGAGRARRLHRIEVRLAGPDARVARRDAVPTGGELDALAARLDAMDRRSADGAWTQTTLELIERWPARRAPDLAAMVGAETQPWKARVRRLKELGLTQSLEVGYRLSPRGAAVVAHRRAPKT